MGSIVKSYDTIASLFNPDTPTFSDSLHKTNFLNNLHKIYDDKSIYPISWSKFKSHIHGISHPFGDPVNMNQPLGSWAWEMIEKAYFGYERMWPFPSVAPIRPEDPYHRAIKDAMNQDLANYIKTHDLESFLIHGRILKSRLLFQGHYLVFN
jgi:hypothetical protein